MYVFVCAHVYICVYVSMLHTYMYVFMYVCVQQCIDECICMYVCLNVYLRAYMHENYIHAYIHTCMCAYAHTYIIGKHTEIHALKLALLNGERICTGFCVVFGPTENRGVPRC